MHGSRPALRWREPIRVSKSNFLNLLGLLLINGNNPYPNGPVGSYPWYTWAAVGVFVLIWFFWYFVRRRR